MQAQVAPRIRALIVDDSALARRMVSQALTAQPDMEVVGLAETGQAALEKVASYAPDVVVLDLEMPGMDGYETLRRLKRSNPHLPVLVYSAHSARGAGATVDALLAGADDYALKPSAGGDADTWSASQLELTAKLRAIALRARRTQSLVTGTRPVIRDSLPAVERHAVTAIAIGTSVGGPEALAVVLPRLPKTLPVPVFVVQHMPQGFTTALARRLREKSQVRVVEAQHGQPAEPGCVFLAPGDYHLQVSNRHQQVSLLLDKGPLENGCRPSVDPLFRSAAQVYGGGLLALVLTGMGSDGLHGAAKVSALGGQVWIQDQESSVVWGMAGAIARAGLARRTVALSAIGSSLSAAIQHGLPPVRTHQEGSRG